MIRMMNNTIPAVRNLDGIYIRVKRDDSYVNRCFTDLTEEEQQAFLEQFDAEGLKRMLMLMARTLRRIGDELDLESTDDD